jgi:hypothetical protein
MTPSVALPRDVFICQAQQIGIVAAQVAASTGIL